MKAIFSSIFILYCFAASGNSMYTDEDLDVPELYERQLDDVQELATRWGKLIKQFHKREPEDDQYFESPEDEEKRAGRLIKQFNKKDDEDKRVGRLIKQFHKKDDEEKEPDD